MELILLENIINLGNIGDKVKTINKKGEVEYSEVYAWFHKSYDDYRNDYINVKMYYVRTVDLIRKIL